MRSSSRRDRLSALLFLGAMGAVFLSVGILLGVFASQQARGAAERAEGLAPLGAADLEGGAPGSEALIEGALSPRNRPRLRDFVAYTREKYQGTDNDGDERWSVEERVTPPLLLDLPDGLVQIGNDDYRVEGAHDLWADGENRYEGLVAGRPVMVIGAIQAGREGRELRAELVFAGTRAAYIESQRASARFLPIFGLIFGGVGALLLGLGLWIGLRR